MNYNLEDVIITDFEGKDTENVFLFENRTKLPKGFSYTFHQDNIDNEDGLYRIYEKKDRKGNITTERIRLTESIIYVKAKVYSIENDNYNYEIAAIHKTFNNKYKIISSMCPSSTLGQRANLIKFLSNNLGVNATDLNYMHFIEYFSQFIYENKNILITKNAIQHLGWHNGKFAQYDDNTTFDFSDDSTGEFKRLVEYAKPKGSLQIWKNIINQFRNSKDFNFILGTSFAAPLLKKTNTRSYIILGRGDSEIGKTFAAHCGLSIWGNPDKLKIGANASDNSIPKLAYQYQNIFMYVDDVIKRGSQAQKGFQDCYVIANETGKRRLNKDSKLMRQDNWRTSGFISSEVDVIKDNANAGEYNRALEYEISKIYTIEKDEISKFYGLLNLNYGHAGKIFTKEIEEIKEIKINEALKKIRDQLLNEFSETKIYNHIICVSASCLGLYFCNKIIFNEDNIEKCIDCGRFILNKLMNKEEGRQEVKAVEEMYNFFEVNQSKFSKEAKLDIYGAVRNEEIIFITGPLKKYIESLGYSYKLLERYLINNKLGEVKQAKIKGKNGKRLVVKLPEEEIKTNYKLYYPVLRNGKYKMNSLEIDISDTDSLDQLDNKQQYFEMNSELELVEFNISKLPLSSNKYLETEREAIETENLPLPKSF